MASMIFGRYGVRISDSDLRGEIPIAEALQRYPSSRWRFLSEQPPRINEPTAVSDGSDFNLVVVRLDGDETRDGIRHAGYYVVERLEPRDATQWLVERALRSEVGNENVVRVIVDGSWMDSENRPAYKVTVEIPQGAVDRISGEAAIKAFRRLRALIEHWPRNGTPLLQYATAAELERHVAA
jgi:hypothetical protein